MTTGRLTSMGAPRRFLTRRGEAFSDTQTTDTAPSPTRDTRAATRNQWLVLAAIGVFALAVRVTWVLAARRNFALKGDDFFYHWQANALADGMGFLNPLTWKALGRI